MFKEFPKLLSDTKLSERAKRSEFAIEQLSKSLFWLAAAEVVKKADGLVISVENRQATEPNDYKVLIKEMVEISNENFLPDFIEASWVSDEHREILVEFKYHQKNYRVRVSVFLSPRKIQGPTLLSSTIVNLVNRALAESGNENRFHKICTVNELNHLRELSIIFLTPEQRTRILEAEALLLPHVESEAGIWTESQTETTIRSLIELGLIPNLSDDEFETFKTNALQDQVGDPVSFLYRIPNLTYTFDTEYITNVSETEKSYIEIINRFAQLSGEVFHPTNLKVVITAPPLSHPHYDRKIKLFFEFNGVKYSKELADFNDWIDLSFIELINQSLIDNKINHSFYSVNTGDQGAMIVFLDNEMAKRINESGIISLQ